MGHRDDEDRVEVRDVVVEVVPFSFTKTCSVAISGLQLIYIGGFDVYK